MPKGRNAKAVRNLVRANGRGHGTMYSPGYEHQRYQGDANSGVAQIKVGSQIYMVWFVYLRAGATEGRKRRQAVAYASISTLLKAPRNALCGIQEGVVKNIPNGAEGQVLRKLFNPLIQDVRPLRDATNDAHKCGW